MLKRIIFRLLERRHYWRYVDFGELAELYASRMLRVLAVSMVAMLVGIYLYQNGYHLTFIAGYFASYFIMRAIMVLPAAFAIARIGPKHGTLISNILYVPALIALTQLPEYGLQALIIFGTLQAISVALYDVSFMVNFSKVRKEDHVGKELSFMFILERVTLGLSPLVGGGIAYFFGPESTMIFASIVFGLAALPLLLSPEPTQTHQKITFRNFNWRATRRGLIAHAATGADYVASSTAWSLFLAIGIFGTTSNTVYAQIGALASFTVIVSLLFTRVYGLIIDRRRGGDLLRIGVWANSFVHILRPFVSTPVGAVLTNVTNEAATTAYAMPFIKGMFAQADELPGYRIVYLSLMTISASLGGALFCLLLSILSMNINEVASLQVGYVVMAFVGLLTLRHGFSALARRTII